MAEKAQSNWTQIIVTALLTGVLTIISGLAVYYFTRQSAELRYSITNADPFYGSSAATTIYKLQITNTGQKEIDDFRANISFPYEKISDHRTTSTGGVVLTEQTGSNTDSLTSDVLNPGDHVDASYLVTFNHVPLEPQVSVRGKGINGTRVSTESAAPSEHLWLTPVMAGSVFMFSIMSSLVAPRIRLGGASFGNVSHYRSQRDVLAFGLFSSGLVSEGEKVLRLRKCHYWSQSDRIAASFREKHDVREIAMAARALETTLAYTPRMAKPSIAVLNYNAAVLWLCAGEEERALARLKLATSDRSELVWARLSLDESMKLFARKNDDALPSDWRQKINGING